MAIVGLGVFLSSVAMWAVWPGFAIVLGVLPLIEVSEKEVGRISSPDGRRSAIIVETDGGATTGYGYSLRIDGKEVAMAYEAVRADGRSGVDVRWIDAGTLEVRFARARFADARPGGGVRIVFRGMVDPPESLRP